MNIGVRSARTSSSASGLVAFFTLSLEDPVPDTPPPPLLLFPAPLLLAGSGRVSAHIQHGGARVRHAWSLE
jgi:hypothetical protein